MKVLYLENLISSLKNLPQSTASATDTLFRLNKRYNFGYAYNLNN